MNAPLHPVQISEQGKNAFSQAKYLEAVELFRAAEEEFSSIGDRLSAAENANNRSVALLKADDAPGALEAVEGTPQIFAMEGDTRRQAMALGNMGNILTRLGRVTEAVSAYEQSAELFKQLGEHEMRAPIMEALSDLQIKTGKPVEAFISLNSGLGEYKKPSIFQRFMKKVVELPLRLFFRY